MVACADRQQLVAQLDTKIQLAMPLKDRQQDGDQRLEGVSRRGGQMLPTSLLPMPPELQRDSPREYCLAVTNRSPELA